MDECNTEIIKTLIESVNLAYSACSDERSQLHTIEWDNSTSQISVLGEVEVIADTVVGIASTYIKYNDKENSINNLKTVSPYESIVIGDWLASNGNKYRAFVAYIASIEALRSCLSSLLRHTE